jgi:hypothetical protein
MMPHVILDSPCVVIMSSFTVSARSLLPAPVPEQEAPCVPPHERPHAP